MKKAILNYIRELSIVIIGISTAFAINQWSEGNKDRKREKQVLETILSELDNNLFYVDDAIESTSTTITTYDSALSILNEKGINDVDLSLKVSKLLFQTNGIDLSIASGVMENMDLDLARDINYCYKFHNNILEFEKTYFNYFEVQQEDEKVYYRQLKVKANNLLSALKSLRSTQIDLKEKIEIYISEKY